MQYGRVPSFDRAYSKLTPASQAAAEAAIARLVHAFDSGRHPVGLGFKKLQREFWEIRAGLAIRILFKKDAGVVIFVIAGTHDEIRRYLKDAK